LAKVVFEPLRTWAWVSPAIMAPANTTAKREYAHFLVSVLEWVFISVLLSERLPVDRCDSEPAPVFTSTCKPNAQRRAQLSFYMYKSVGDKYLDQLHGLRRLLYPIAKPLVLCPRNDGAPEVFDGTPSVAGGNNPAYGGRGSYHSRLLLNRRGVGAGFTLQGSLLLNPQELIGGN